MKAYKGVTKGLKGCNGFQFEVGKTYHEEKAKCHSCGFHVGDRIGVCMQNGFTPSKDIILEVEIFGDIDREQVSGGYAYAATDITILRILSQEEIMQMIAFGEVV